MSHSPTETIFDFHVTETPPAQLLAWQGQAEFLLDEAVAGAASFQATDGENLREQWTEPGRHLRPENGDQPASRNNGRRSANLPLQASPPPGSANTTADTGLLRAEISGLLDVEPDQIRVFSEDELPAIRSQGALPLVTPLLAYTQPARQETRPSFVDGGAPSRFLRDTPPQAALQPMPQEPNTPATQGSLLSRPAPALGKVPAPAAPPVSLTAGQVRFLDEEIGHLYGEVNRVLATRREVTGHALSLLREAREILLAEPHRLGRAEHNLQQVRGMLERAHESRRRSSRRGFRILLYLSLWLAGTVAAGVSLFLYGADLSRIVGALTESQSRILAHLHPFLWVMITGSAGAVVGAILGFLAHLRSEQDFDRQHVLRFAIQPVMGVVLGILLYFFFSLLFASMQLDLTARPITRTLPVVLALPVGLWQEWIYASIYRMLGFFTLRPRRR